MKKARAQFISLVPRGANTLPTFYKSEDGFEIRTLLKASDDAGEITAVVYAPEVTDSQGDVASADVIKDMAYAFQKEGGQLDMRHDGKIIDKTRAYVAETFIVQKGDERFSSMKDYAGKPVDVTGAWAVVVKVEDPELRALYREGGWQGVSIGGFGEFEAPEGTSMTKEELAGAFEALGKQLLEGLKQAAPAPVTKEAPAVVPVFKGDPSDLKAVRAHRQALQKQALLAQVDWSNAESVAAYEAELEKATEASKASNVPVTKGEAYEDAATRLLKTHMAEGSKLAAIANGARFPGEK
jgi:hypothetical protein